jgi:predicted Ser/Thr protein kinase
MISLTIFFFIVLFIILLSQKKEYFLTFTKKFNNNYYYSGLSKYDSYKIEKRCLERLQKNYKCICKKKSNHFPKIIDYNDNKRVLKMTHLGETLRNISNNKFKNKNINFEEQINCIDYNLKKAKVNHLDMHLSGKNMVINDDSILGVIDFDLATIDDRNDKVSKIIPINRTVCKNILPKTKCEPKISIKDSIKQILKNVNLLN